MMSAALIDDRRIGPVRSPPDPLSTRLLESRSYVLIFLLIFMVYDLECA